MKKIFAAVGGFFRKIWAWAKAHKAASITACAVFAAGIAALIVFVLMPPVHDPVPITAEITPTLIDSNGVYTESEFLIAGERFKDKDDLLAQLTAGTDIPFSVRGTAEGNYLLTFESPLEQDAILKFMIDDGNGNDRSYAFQTKADFGVRSFFPRNNAYVPADTGIEITFTNADFSDYEQYITLEPETPHTIEKIGDRVVLIPQQPLEINTDYTVTVKAGLANSAGDTLDGDSSATFSITEEMSEGELIKRSGAFEETFLTTDVPVIELRADTYSDAGRYIDYGSVAFDVTVSGVKDADAYAALLKAKEERDVSRHNYNYVNDKKYEAVDTAGMETVLRATLNPMPYASGQYSTCYLVLPQELPEGWYVVTATADVGGAPVTVQKLLQVNDTVVYMRSERKQLVVWVNDAKSESVASGASVTLDGADTVKTAADGSAVIKLDGEMRAGIVSIEIGGRKPFISSILLAPEEELTACEKYRAYLYTDRASYLPTDKIRVFGVIEGLFGSSLPDNVTVAFGNEDYYYDYASSYSYEKMPQDARLLSCEAQVDGNGVFSAELSLANMQSGFYQLGLLIGDDCIYTEYLQIEEYTKPAFTVTFDELKDYYRLGEAVHFGMTAQYYGGIPAANEEFEINDTVYVTDQKGRIAFDMLAYPGYDVESWCPAENAVYVEDALTLDSVNHYAVRYRVLPKTTMMTADAKLADDGTVSVSVRTNMLNEDAFGEEYDFYNNADKYRGAPYDTNVDVTVTRVSYAPPTEYTYYDYILKKNVTTWIYSYDKTEEYAAGGTFATVGGKLDESFALEPIENGYYTVTVTCADTAGALIKSTATASQGDIYTYHNSSNIKHYYFTDDVNKSLWDGIMLDSRKIGDECALFMVDEEGAVPDHGSVMLGIVNSAVSENSLCGAEFKFDFDKKYAPNIHLVGAYFDGKRVFKINRSVIACDYSDSRLDVKVSTDKENYAPGDEVKITVSAADKNGKPHGGSVNISVVDEAQFAVSPQFADIFGGFYSRQLGSGIRASFVSYTQHSFNGFCESGGEGGGGEDSGVSRQDFVDTAAFETVSMDKNGRAELTVKLPDNVTDWRITVSAVSDDYYGGNTKKTVSASLPFVVDAVIGKVYQTGDDVSFGAHAYGEAVSASAAVELTAAVSGAGFEKKLTQSASGNSFTYFNLGKLAEGEYTVTVSGKSGGSSDSITESFKVIANADELPIGQSCDLAQCAEIKPLRSPVTVVTGNGNAQYVASSLYALYSSVGGRTDQRLASAKAGRMLADFANDDEKGFYDVMEAKVGEWQNASGGISIYPYADDDPFVTAFAAWASPESIDASALQRYADGTDDIEKYIALAAMQKPVLLKVRTLLEETSEDDLYARMVFACALAAIGDDSDSEAEFDRTFRALVAEAEDGSARISTGGDEDINDRLTAMALTVVSRTDRELAKMMMKYLAEKETLTDFYGLQQIIYAKNMLRGAFGPVTYEYTAADGRKTVTLNGIEIRTLRMTAEQYAAADFAVKYGAVDASVYYTGSSDVLNASEAKYSVSKSVRPVSGGSIAVGDKVRVEIKLPKSGKMLTVSDYIPSGFRFSEYSWDESSEAWLAAQEGQRVTICAFPDNTEARAVFYIRAVAPGNFALNSAYVFDADGEWGFTERGTVSVK